MKHTYELGKKYGVIKGTRKYLDETGMTGAVGIVIGLGAVLIALYIIAIVVGSMGTQVTTGNIVLSSQWNTTISSIDTSASSTFNDCNVKLNQLDMQRRKYCQHSSDSYSGGRHHDNCCRRLRGSVILFPGNLSRVDLYPPNKFNNFLVCMAFN